MKKTPQLRDFFIGKIDAKNELLTNSEKENKRFLDSYLVPENLTLSSFYNGQKYIISGLKGTGKTALLQYIALSAQKDIEAHTSFILFKSEFTEDDKKDFSRAINTTYSDKTTIPEEEDYTNIWQWFLHRHFVKNIKSNSLPFHDNKEFQKYKECVLAPKIGDESSGITSFLPSLKRGNVELEGDFEFFKGKLGLDFEWINKERRQVKFNSIVKQADELFKKLTPSSNKYLIFIDELELTLGKLKTYEKDIRLIRDLIVAVNTINNLCLKSNYPINFITAIRSEVLTSIPASGKEINKVISDFGITLNWNQAGSSVNQQPLIKIINKKLRASEHAMEIDMTENGDQLWSKYFSSQINGSTPQEYILHNTWYRPRDIVRLLSIAQEQYPNSTQFTNVVFNGIRKDYSTKSWVEHTEELRTKFSSDDIEGIKKILYGLKCPFSYNDITIECDRKKKMYDIVAKVLEKYHLGDILSAIYKIGIIGNCGERVRFSFRGDDDILLEKPMKVHDPLWNYLSIESKNSTQQ
jgi:hypothetical protein